MHKPTELICLGAVLAMSLLATMSCEAQDSELVVVPMQHVQAELVVRMVAQIAREEAPEMVVDQRLNRVFAKGSLESLSLMKKLIEEMDVQKPKPVKQPETEVRVFPLANAHAANVANVLSDLITNDQAQTMRLSLEEPSNSIVVSGLPSDLHVIEDLIARLDQSGPTAEAGKSTTAENIIVRVTWLVDVSQLPENQVRESFRQPVAAHESLVKALTDSGSMSSIGSLTSSATSIQINESESEQTDFTNSSMRNLNGTLHTIIASGVVRKSSNDNYELDIDLELAQGPVQLSVGSTIVLPRNHPVAFSVSDVGDFRSAAVVEILEGN